jgi:sigma-E factor negative regulatory protein RseC
MSAKEAAITHPGVINKVEGSKVYVKILAQSACSSCHAKGMCSVAEMEEKIVEVFNFDKRTFSTGEQVTVYMKKTLGNKAVMWAYILPFILVLATLLTMISLTGNEGLAGILAFLVLVPYYLTLYLLRDRMQKTFVFRIR